MTAQLQVDLAAARDHIQKARDLIRDVPALEDAAHGLGAFRVLVTNHLIALRREDRDRRAEWSTPLGAFKW